MENLRSSPNNSSGYPWKLFWLLLVACVLGVGAVLPYVFALFRKVISAGPLPMPLPVLIAVQLMESAILFGAVIAVGLLLARKVGLEAPILDHWLYSRKRPPPQGAWRVPLLTGAGIGGAIVLLLYTVFLPRIPQWPVGAEAMVPIWQRLLACFYGAINEEVLMRLFLLSLVMHIFGPMFIRT